MIAASLLVIALTGALLGSHEVRSHRNLARAEGVGLARALSRIPLERLRPKPGEQNLLHLIGLGQTNRDFAYVALVDPGGDLLADVVTPGVIIPRAPVQADPTSWTEERVLLTGEHARSVREFLAPVIEDGELVAQIRVAFFEPDATLLLHHLPLLGTLSMLVFLLTPLSYLLVRREAQPIAAAASQLQRLVDQQSIAPVQLERPGELSEFLQFFNRFVELADHRHRETLSEQTAIVASSKVVSYQKARIEAVLDALPYGVLVMEPSGRAAITNVRFDALLDLPSGAISGQHLNDWCPSDAIKRFLSPYQGSGRRRVRAGEIEVSPSPDGNRRLLVSAHPVSPDPAAGASASTLVVFSDVTADHCDREAQREFLARMAHEIQSPLHVISVTSESLMEEQGRKDEFRIELCDVIQDEVERLSTLIQALLGIARIESRNVPLKRQRIRVREFLEDVFEVARRTGEDKRIHFVFDVPSDLEPIYADKDLLRIALNNLLTNAVKYNRDEGSVTLSAEESPDSIEIRVQDTGIGIPLDDIGSVFDKFFRSEAAESHATTGHGLGLSMVKEIIDSHAAQAQVQSTPGEGSTFTLIFRKFAPRAGDPE